MNIKARITGIKYEFVLSKELDEIDWENFNINKTPPSCILKDGTHFLAVSKWVSPKRTRSYPYERVYNTLNSSKKITIIPIIKDEGKMEIKMVYNGILFHSCLCLTYL